MRNRRGFACHRATKAAYADVSGIANVCFLDEPGKTFRRG